MTRRIDLNDIRLLMQVIEHGSYTAASRAVGVPKSTISQRIAALEHAVGTGLLRRTSRSFSLTEAGTQLLPHARAIEDLARQVEQSLLERGDELQGTLRVSCSNALAQFAVSPLLPKFLSKHEQVVVRIEVSNRMVDLISEGFDLTVRAHINALKDSVLLQRVVARAPWTLTASPSWIETHGLPATPADIPAGETLCFAAGTDFDPWTLRQGEIEQVITLEPRLVSDDMATLRASALVGGGLTTLPEYILRSEIEAGRLVHVLPEWTAGLSTISVVTPPKAQSSRLARAFSDYLSAELPKTIQPIVSRCPA